MRLKLAIPAIMLVAALCVVAIPAAAQVGANRAATAVAIWSSSQPAPTVSNVNAGLSDMLAELKLTPQQVEQINKILKAEIPKLQKLKDTPGLPLAQGSEQAKAIRAEARKQIMPILTADQRAQLKVMMFQRAQEAQDEAAAW